jgi:hypothetical protein
MLPRLAQMLSYLAENYECILKFLSLLVLKRFTRLSPYYYTTAPQYEGRKDRSTLLRILSSQETLAKTLNMPESTRILFVIQSSRGRYACPLQLIIKNKQGSFIRNSLTITMCIPKQNEKQTKFFKQKTSSSCGHSKVLAPGSRPSPPTYKLQCPRSQ